MDDSRGRRTLHWTPVAGILVLILVVTLARPEQPASDERMIDWCFACGSQWGIDFALNIALFIPLGVALRLARVRPMRAMMIAVGTTLAIELTQLLIPGRVTSTGDVIANAVGGLAGYAIGGQLRALSVPGTRQAVALLVVTGVAVPGVLAFTLWLFRPAPTAHPYWGQFAPELGQFERFDGRVIEASVGGERLRNGRLPNTGAVRERLRGRVAELRAIVEPGQATVGLAPAVSIFDREHNEILLLGRTRSDLVFRLRSNATRLGFRTPSVTVWNGFGLGPRDNRAVPLHVVARVQGWSISAEAWLDTARAERTIEFRPTQGWAYLLPFEHLYMPAMRRFTFYWMAALLVPLGYYAAFALARLTRAPERLAVLGWVGGVAAASLLGLPAMAGLSSGTSWEWQGAGAGVATGMLIGFGVMGVIALWTPDSDHEPAPEA
jgi:VanZ family protein